MNEQPIEAPCHVIPAWLVVVGAIDTALQPDGSYAVVGTADEEDEEHGNG